jgi:PAS domain S-box-containing protein
MGVLDNPKFDQIKQLLQWHPLGMTISDLSLHMNINRNLVAKYLDLLYFAGQVEFRSVGPAKLYSLSQRVPLSAMLEFSSNMIMILNETNMILEVNEPFLAMLDMPREAVLGKYIHDIEDPFIKQLAITDFTGDPRTKTGDNDGMKSLIQAGKTHYVQIKKVPILFEDGSQGITCIIEDITQVVEYQELLAQNEAKYCGIFEDQTDFVTRFLPDGTRIFTNAAYANYLGKAPGNLTGGLYIPNLFEEDRGYVEQMIHSLSPDTPVRTFDCRATDGSGNIRWNRWTARALYNESNIFIIQATGHDITREREQEEKEKKYIQNMEFLRRTALEFVDMGDDEDIYRYVTCQIYRLAPHSLVGINAYDPGTDTLMMKYVMGDHEEIEHMIREMKTNLFGLVFPLHIRPDAKQAFSQKNLVRGPDLYNLFFQVVPKDICDRVASDLNFGQCYVMGFSHRGEIFGNIGIQLKKGMELINKETIEAFVGQASVALLKRQGQPNPTREL